MRKISKRKQLKYSSNRTLPHYIAIELSAFVYVDKLKKTQLDVHRKRPGHREDQKSFLWSLQVKLRVHRESWWGVMCRANSLKVRVIIKIRETFDKACCNLNEGLWMKEKLKDEGEIKS